MDPIKIETVQRDIEEKNYAAALRMLLPLANADDPFALCNLAVLYQCGLGVESNGRKAVDLYLRVGELKIRDMQLSATAYHNLATMYATGSLGISPDLKKACEYERLAKDLGFGM